MTKIEDREDREDRERAMFGCTDGTAELVVEREVHDQYDRPGKGYWATYYIDQHAAVGEAVPR